MEKKTIGGFIAALRKANGMTQKELAERLNVSDKTVSRWERDDGAPDLSVIPVLAEIFDVTCDELLRGARRPPAERAEAPEDAASPKGEKQRRRLIKSALSQYQNRSCIAMGVSVVGVLVALICDLAFLRAVLGFLCGAVFFAASVVCQAVCMNKAFLRVEDAGIDEAALSAYRRKVIGLAERSIGLTVLFVGFTFPLVLVDAYLGLGPGNLLLWGSVGAAACMAVYAVALYVLHGALLRKGVYSLPEKELAAYAHDRKLKRKCAVSLAVLLGATLALHAFGSEMLWSPYQLSSAHGITFDDYESFVAYMEQDIPADRYEAHDNGPASIPVPQEPAEGSAYYDAFGNEISEEEALTRTLEDSDGHVVCTYIQRNENVAFLRYTAKEGSVLPIRVITAGDYRAAARLSGLIAAAYCVLYPVELLAVLLVYGKKRAK